MAGSVGQWTMVPTLSARKKHLALRKQQGPICYSPFEGTAMGREEKRLEFPREMRGADRPKWAGPGTAPTDVHHAWSLTDVHASTPKAQGCPCPQRRDTASSVRKVKYLPSQGSSQEGRQVGQLGASREREREREGKDGLTWGLDLGANKYLGTEGGLETTIHWFWYLLQPYFCPGHRRMKSDFMKQSRRILDA